jgi:hypothetical protein
MVNLLKRILLSLLLVVVGIAVGISATLAVFYFGSDDLYNNVLGKSEQSETTPIGNHGFERRTHGFMRFEVLGYLKQGDYEAFSKTVHPDYGVVYFRRTRPSALYSNNRFTAKQVAGFRHRQQPLCLGEIRRQRRRSRSSSTPAEYIKEFVFFLDKGFYADA